MFNQLGNLACVDVNHISRVVHYVVSENRPNVVSNVGKQIPYMLLGLVFPFLVLNVVPKKVSELEPIGEGEICLVQSFNGLWSGQRAIHDNGIYQNNGEENASSSPPS